MNDAKREAAPILKSSLPPSLGGSVSSLVSSVAQHESRARPETDQPVRPCEDWAGTERKTVGLLLLKYFLPGRPEKG